MTLVHDLAALRWLLLSPPLLSDAAAPCAGAVQRFSSAQHKLIANWLTDLEASPQAFEAHLARARASVGGVRPVGCEPLRLGRLAERLLEFFLNQGPLHHGVASNLPMRSAGGEGNRTTQGEIDFLLHGPDGQPLHWELAVKYFLCRAVGNTAEPGDFIGPDEAETFERKLQKLMHRQLRLKPPPPWDRQEWQPQAFARGWMFYRFGQPIPHCEALNPDHLRGWWLPHADCADLPDDARYVELPRGAWMPRCELPADANTWGRDELAETLMQRWWDQRHLATAQHAFPRIQRAQAAAARPSARLVVGLQLQHGKWVEQARYFVKPPEALTLRNA